MIGKWLGALLSTPTSQTRLSGGTDAEVDFAPNAKGHGLWRASS
jgi:hypothetical protein